MQIKAFRLVNIKVIDEYNNVLYEGSVDYADNEIKELTYKDLKPTGSEIIFYV